MKIENQFSLIKFILKLFIHFIFLNIQDLSINGRENKKIIFDISNRETEMSFAHYQLKKKTNIHKTSFEPFPIKEFFEWSAANFYVI